MDLAAAVGLGDLSVGTLTLLLMMALLAGWIDAVAGGGGLIQLPVLLMVPGLAPAQVLGTNKVASAMGTVAATVTYRRKIGLPSGVLTTAAGAFVTALCGALTATRLPTRIFTPVIVTALLIVLTITVLRPSAFGRTSDTEGGKKRGKKLSPRSARVRTCTISAVVGFYDGMLGPGTGSFLLLGFIMLASLEALSAVAMTKAVNLATNTGALLLFSLTGTVQWRLGLFMGGMNMLGGYLGARTATWLGPRFVRAGLIVVVLALLIKLLAF